MMWDDQRMLSPEDEVKEKLNLLKNRIKDIKDEMSRNTDDYNKKILKLNVMLDTAQQQYEAWIKILEKLHA